MSASVVTVSPDQTLREVVVLLQSKRIRQMPVLDNNGEVVGIITDRDVKRATPSVLSGVERKEYDRVLDETPVSHLMTREPIMVTAETPLKEAVQIFVSKKVGALPVLSGEKLVGILTQTDALKVLLTMLK